MIIKKYLIIGNGVAGTTAAENIRRLDPNGEITIVTDEDIPFYYRVRLPDYLGGGVAESELVAKTDAWYKEKNISLQLETTITGGDPGEKNVQQHHGGHVRRRGLRIDQSLARARRVTVIMLSVSMLFPAV